MRRVNQLSIVCKVNGRDVARTVEPGATLLDFLRRDLGFTGAKEGCGKGECGACTVLLDGRVVAACLVLAVQADGSEVTTIEGISSGDGGLHPVQEALVAEGAVQCGYCTPGVALSLASATADGKVLSGGRVVEALEGNLCRCTGYQKIRDAVASLSRRQADDH